MGVLSKTTQVKATEGTTERTIGGQIEILTDRQKEVFKLIKEDHKITRKEISNKLGIAESAVQKHLKALKDTKVIERVGTKKG